ncbi:MAG: Na+/H+ antiporter subunit E [Chromatiales bacterium]|jgi:multicomponent Na+:H+ antiporter subunit E
MNIDPREATPSDLPSGLFLFVLSYALWLLLAGSLAPAELIAGLLVALVVTLISRPHLEIFNGLRLTPSAIPSFLAYLGVFLLALVRANLDMARRVLSPTLPLQPALVVVKTELQSPLGRLILANSITLTPGTLSVDVSDGTLLIHWIDAPDDIDVEGATRAIIHPYERTLKGFVK